MTVITRFAPSPTGHLHVGNLRVAIANALVSKCLEGRFILRYDDTDTDRSSDEFIHSIANDLNFSISKTFCGTIIYPFSIRK